MKLSRISGRERMACDEKEAADCIEKEERNREKKWRGKVVNEMEEGRK